MTQTIDHNDKNVIAKAQTHSLFSSKDTQITNKYRLFINQFANYNNDIHEIYNILQSASITDTLELRISSPGGLVTECQNIINIMKNKFSKRVTSYIDSRASSAGALVFCASDKRVVYVNSRIMIHNYSGMYQGEFQKMKTRIEFDEQHTIDFIMDNLKIGKDGFLTKKECKQMIKGKEFWFNTEDMCKRGIATHVIVNGKTIKAKKYLKSLKTTNKDK